MSDAVPDAVPDHRQIRELNDEPDRVRADVQYLMQREGVKSTTAIARAISMCAMIRRVEEHGGEVWLSASPGHRPRSIWFR
jgi:hypothetical protein